MKVEDNILYMDGKQYDITERKQETLEELLCEYDSKADVILAIDDKKHYNKLKSIRNMLIVADYVNEGWTPDWREEDIYMIEYDTKDDEPYIDTTYSYLESFVYFKSREATREAIKILGKEIIKTALS